MIGVMAISSHPTFTVLLGYKLGHHRLERRHLERRRLEHRRLPHAADASSATLPREHRRLERRRLVCRRLERRRLVHRRCCESRRESIVTRRGYANSGRTRLWHHHRACGRVMCAACWSFFCIWQPSAVLSCGRRSIIFNRSAGHRLGCNSASASILELLNPSLDATPEFDGEALRAERSRLGNTWAPVVAASRPIGIQLRGSRSYPVLVPVKLKL